MNSKDNNYTPKKLKLHIERVEKHIDAYMKQMDVADKEVTFDGFWRWAVRVIVASIAVLIFLAIFNS